MRRGSSTAALGARSPGGWDSFGLSLSIHRPSSCSLVQYKSVYLPGFSVNICRDMKLSSPTSEVWLESDECGWWADFENKKKVKIQKSIIGADLPRRPKSSVFAISVTVYNFFRY